MYINIIYIYIYITINIYLYKDVCPEGEKTYTIHAVYMYIICVRPLYNVRYTWIYFIYIALTPAYQVTRPGLAVDRRSPRAAALHPWRSACGSMPWNLGTSPEMFPSSNSKTEWCKTILHRHVWLSTEWGWGWWSWWWSSWWWWWWSNWSCDCREFDTGEETTGINNKNHQGTRLPSETAHANFQGNQEHQILLQEETQMNRFYGFLWHLTS